MTALPWGVHPMCYRSITHQFSVRPPGSPGEDYSAASSENHSFTTDQHAMGTECPMIFSGTPVTRLFRAHEQVQERKNIGTDTRKIVGTPVEVNGWICKTWPHGWVKITEGKHRCHRSCCPRRLSDQIGFHLPGPQRRHWTSIGPPSFNGVDPTDLLNGGGPVPALPRRVIRA